MTEVTYDLDFFRIEPPDAVLDAPSERREGLAGERAWFLVEQDPDETRRTEQPAKALSSGRIRGWTGMNGCDLWRQWVERFGGDEDLAREHALRTCERLVRDRCPASQERLFEIKRTLLGWHARARLDERYEQRGIEGVWWTRRDEAIDEFEYAELPLPWKGLVRVLKCLVWQRARIRPCDL